MFAVIFFSIKKGDVHYMLISFLFTAIAGVVCTSLENLTNMVLKLFLKLICILQQVS